ncbi:hypothetical protein B2G50_11260 [Leptospira interrogans serovar Canicola]|nr:hypothetical protein B2G47_01970 [Leptospira interrogans serovar Canicola]ASV09197.1 hypothetical protein B2G50_11260 [Leptospira interrogans serovar Canicola]
MHKTAILRSGHRQNLTHFSISSTEKDFSKSMSSYNFRFVYKILVCSSSHIFVKLNRIIRSNQC